MTNQIDGYSRNIWAKNSRRTLSAVHVYCVHSLSLKLGMASRDASSRRRQTLLRLLWTPISQTVPVGTF